MSFLSTLSGLLPVVIEHNFGPQRLERTPEPEAVTTNPNSVLQYDQVMSTKLAIAYAILLEVVYRARTEPFGGTALELACGPGHLAVLLARRLKLEHMRGIDLSDEMIETANRNARQNSALLLEFNTGDVTKLHHLPSESVDLTVFADAAHHMPDLETVSQVLAQMDRITRDKGLAVVMDLARLRTAHATDRYVEVLAHDYVASGLAAFKDDFRNSMFAAWTPAELETTLPRGSERVWMQWLPRALPTVQFLLGLPRGRSRLYVRDEPPWNLHDRPVPDVAITEWRQLRLSLAVGRRDTLKSNQS